MSYSAAVTVSLILAGALALSGCADFANTRNFAAMGTVLGAGAGIAVGAATGDMAQGAMLGAGLGGLGGAALGHSWENQSRKKAGKDLLREVEEDMLGGKDTIEGIGVGRWETVKESRWVDTSKTKRVWVEEKVVDGAVVDAHFEQRLIPSGYWVEEEKRVWVEDNLTGKAENR